MKIPQPAADCAEALSKKFPVEDIWFFDASAAKECLLDKPLNLVVIVPEAAGAHVLDERARDWLRQQFGENDVDVHVFPRSAIERMPRPLLVKMALTCGENLTSR